MKTLITGSAGHLGEALARTLRAAGREFRGIDLLASPFTEATGDLANRDFVRASMGGIDAVLHCATLHKPHVATHAQQAFVDTNITGTLNLLEEARTARVRAFVFVSTTSVFGDALVPPPGTPAAWIDEDVVPKPKNIYGATKAAAEDLCQLFHRNHDLPCIVLRTSRFFPEEDDNAAAREAFDGLNLKVNELLYRRIDVADIVSAALLALERAPDLGFGKYILSATTPFGPWDLEALRQDMPGVVRRYVPAFEAVFEGRGWRMNAGLDRVYVNERARGALGWCPEYDFARAIEDLAAGRDPRSALALEVGSKGYHQERFEEGPYPV